METKFIIRDKVRGFYFLAKNKGYTWHKSLAYQYTREEIISKSYFNKETEVLIPVTPSKSTLYRLQLTSGEGAGRYVVHGRITTTDIAMATLYSKEEFLTKFNPYHFKAIPVKR